MRAVGRSVRLGDRVLHTGFFLAAWVAVGVLARLAVPEDQSLALIWPAAGVAVLWFLVRGVSWRSVDTVLLAGAAFTVNYATGAPVDLALVLAVTYVGGETAQSTLGLPSAATGVLQAMLLFLLLATDVLINYRLRLRGKTGAAS